MTSRTVVPQDPVIQAVLTVLAGSGFSIGDNEAPPTPSPAFPYGVLYSLDDQERERPIPETSRAKPNWAEQASKYVQCRREP